MNARLPVVPASFSTADGSACAVLDASALIEDPLFDADCFAKLARDGFSGMAVGHVLMDHFVSRRGDEGATRVLAKSCESGGGVRGRILSGDFIRLVVRNRPDVYEAFSEAYSDDPVLGSYCAHRPELSTITPPTG
ncbi:hypothetical protein PQI07_26925 [Methylobacterium sp. 092160098-2]|uniref:hypothetical protein n=1 Tax=Methylobacterium sp. 092160098-2 TaxID=3025129 RepID=UPI002381A29A|nr:hypothetical protein [Methylobacterium sp. 092160098-2]MDE4914307.1 hypothetical protein [Methylobacterium sp. 092160098-2]